MDLTVPLVLVACYAALKGLAWWAQPRTYARGMLREAENVAIADVEHGDWVKVTGVVAARTTTTSPFGGLPCVGFRLEVERVGRPMLPLALEREACESFSITDETGRLEVIGPFVIGLDFEDRWTLTSEAEVDYLRRAGVRIPGLTFSAQFAYREALLVVGDRVSVLGQVFYESDPTENATVRRSPPVVARMRGTRRQPVVIADAGKRVSG